MERLNAEDREAGTKEIALEPEAEGSHRRGPTHRLLPPRRARDPLPGLHDEDARPRRRAKKPKASTTSTASASTTTASGRSRRSGRGVARLPRIPRGRRPDPSVKRLLPWMVAVAFLMESLDTTILNTAVPTIADALGVVPLSMKSVLSSYTLSLAVFIPVSGWIVGQVRHAPRLRVRDRHLHARLAPLRPLHEHPRPRRLPHPAGHGRRADGAGRPPHDRAHVREVRARDAR